MPRKQKDNPFIFLILIPLIAFTFAGMSIYFNCVAAWSFGGYFAIVIVGSDIIKYISIPVVGWAWNDYGNREGFFAPIQFSLVFVFTIIFVVCVLGSLYAGMLFFQKAMMESRNTAVNNSIEVKAAEAQLQLYQDRIKDYGSGGKQAVITEAKELENEALSLTKRANSIRSTIASKQAKIDAWWTKKYKGFPHTYIMDSNCNYKHHMRTAAGIICDDLNALKDSLGISAQSSKIATLETSAKASTEKANELTTLANEYDSLRSNEILAMQDIADARKNSNSGVFVSSVLGNNKKIIAVIPLIGYSLTKIEFIALCFSVFIEVIAVVLFFVLFLRGQGNTPRRNYQPVSTLVNTTHQGILTRLTGGLLGQPINHGQPLINGRVDGQPSQGQPVEYVPYPTPQPHPLNVDIGIDTQGNRVVVCLERLPHLLTGGLTGGGKSVFIKSLTSQLIDNTSPEEVQIIAIDMKNGSTFFKFNGDKHFARPIAVSKDEVNDYLQWLTEERDRRQNILTAANCEDISEYKEEKGCLPFPYMVIILEEIKQAISAHKDNKVLIEDLHSLCRSAGMHIFDCTQYPKADVLDTAITANCGGRLCFQMVNHSQSMVVLGQKGAENLTGNGHAIFVNGKHSIELRTHLYTKEMIMDIVAKSKAQYGEAVYDAYDTEDNTCDIDRNVVDIQKKSVTLATNYSLIVDTFNELASQGMKATVQLISETTGINKGTVSKQLSRARENNDLRTHLQEA